MSLIDDAINVAAPEVGVITRLITPARLVCLVLLLAVGAQQARIEGLYLRPHVGPVGATLINLPGWKPRAIAAEAALAKVEAAGVQAAAAQIAVNHQPAVISAAIARTSDADAQTYYAKGRAAGAAYALAHPVGGLCSPEDPGGAVRADLSGPDHAAPVNDGPGDVANMVAVARADFDQLTANSLRLAKVRQDAETLIASGVARAEIQEGK